MEKQLAENDARRSLWGELVLYGGMAGGVAAPLKLIVHHIFTWTSHARPFYAKLNAYLIHGHHHRGGFAEAIFGELGDVAIGALLGILLSLVLRHSRPRYHWWLGAGFGFGIWFLTLAGGNLTHIIPQNETDAVSLLAHLLAMIAFGLFVVLASRVWKPLRDRIRIS